LGQIQRIKSISIIIGLLYLSCNSIQSTYKRVDNEEFKELIKLKNVQIIDVRTPREVLDGKIPGSVNIDFYNENFSKSIAKLDKGKVVAIYCAGGVRSNKAAALLDKLGFKKVVDLKNGFKSWKKEGFPTIKP